MAVETSGLVAEFLGSQCSAAHGPPSDYSTPSIWTPQVGAGWGTGTLTNFDGTSTSGWVGDGSEGSPYALYFDGVDTVVNFGDFEGAELTSAATWEFWFYRTGGHQYGRLAYKRTSPSGWGIYVDGTNNQVRLSTRYSTTPTDLDQPFTVGESISGAWKHLVFTYAASTGELWCHWQGGDGVGGYSGTVSPSGGGDLVNDPTGPLVFGNNPADTTRPFGGMVATVRLYDVALSQSQVEDNFAAGVLAASGLGISPPESSFTGLIVTRLLNG